MSAQQEDRSPRATSRAAALGIALVTVIAPVGLWSATSAGAVQTPPATGCPAGYQTLSVAALGSDYRLPGLLDNAGNQDGLVCGKPYNDASTAQLCGSPCGVPIFYLFADNNLTPQH